MTKKMVLNTALLIAGITGACCAIYFGLTRGLVELVEYLNGETMINAHILFASAWLSLGFWGATALGIIGTGNCGRKGGKR